MIRGVFVFAAVLLASLSGVRAADTTVPPPAGISSRAGEDTAFFESRIRPILVGRCYECHSADRKQKGNPLLDSREGTLKGGDTAPAVVPGDPEKKAPLPKTGPIKLQTHGGEIRWRNVFIKQLAAKVR